MERFGANPYNTDDASCEEIEPDLAFLWGESLARECKNWCIRGKPMGNSVRPSSESIPSWTPPLQKNVDAS